MKKIILTLCLCVSMVSVFAASNQGTAPADATVKLSAAEEVEALNKVWSENKSDYVALYKQIKRLQTSKAANANAQIAIAKKKMKAIEKKIDDVNPATKKGKDYKWTIFHEIGQITYW